MNIIEKLEFLTLWSELAKLGTNKLVQRMYLWLFITPTAVKILDSLEEWSKYISLKNIAVDLDLPFSWLLFFLASLLFTLGTIIFNSYCPKIIKSHSNYASFEDTKLPIMKIWHFTKDLSAKGKSNIYLKLHIQNFEDMKTDDQEPSRLFYVSGRSMMTSDYIFYKVYDTANNDFLCSRILVFAFYSIGILLFSLVVIQNIIYVVGELLNG